MSERIYGVADKGWPICKGCSPSMSCSPRCWAARECHRLADNPNAKIAEFHRGLTDERGHWTGEVRLNEAHLTDPLRWRGAQVIASGYHGDWMRLDFPEIIRFWSVMAECYSNPHGEAPGGHQFLLLSKCTAGMHGTIDALREPIAAAWECFDGGRFPWPLPNVWLGFSASNQSEFDARWKHVAKLAAAGWKTWVSLEPLIGPVDVSKALFRPKYPDARPEMREQYADAWARMHPTLSQVVLGGESGKGARPMHPDWVRKVRDDCEAANVPFMFKQHGEWIGVTDLKSLPGGEGPGFGAYDHYRYDQQHESVRVGKKLAGRTLDGRTHDELAWEVGR